MSYFGSRAMRFSLGLSNEQIGTTCGMFYRISGCLSMPASNAGSAVRRHPHEAIRLPANAAGRQPEAPAPGHAQIGPEDEETGITLAHYLHQSAHRPPARNAQQLGLDAERRRASSRRPHSLQILLVRQ